MEIKFREYMVILYYDDISFGYQCVKRLPFMTKDGLFDVTNNIDVLYFNDMMSDEDIAHTSSKNMPPLNSILYDVDKTEYCLHSYNMNRMMVDAMRTNKKWNKNTQEIFNRFFIKENKIDMKINTILDHDIRHELILDGHSCEYRDYIYNIHPISCSFTMMCMDNEPTEELIKEILDSLIKKYPFKKYSVSRIHHPVLEKVFESEVGD